MDSEYIKRIERMREEEKEKDENIKRVIKNSLEIKENIKILQKKKKIIDKMIYKYMNIKQIIIIENNEIIAKKQGEVVELNWKEGYGDVDDSFK